MHINFEVVVVLADSVEHAMVSVGHSVVSESVSRHPMTEVH